MYDALICSSLAVRGLAALGVAGLLGAWEHVVDAGGTSLDIADFAAMELEADESDAPPAWFFGLSGFAVVAVGGVMLHRRRKRTRAEAAAELDAG